MTDPDGSAPAVTPGDASEFYLKETAPAEGGALGQDPDAVDARCGAASRCNETFIEGTWLRDLRLGGGS